MCTEVGRPALYVMAFDNQRTGYLKVNTLIDDPID
jgi:hypothetical protein